MTNVSNEDKDFFKNMLTSLGGNSVPSQPIQNKTTVTEAGDPRYIDLEQNKKAMMNILSNFNSFMNDSAERVVADVDKDIPLRRALITESVNDGVKIGNWLLKKNNKRVDLYNTETKDYLVKGMMYEAAHLLATMLTEGKHLRSPEVKEVLQLEEQYTSSLLNMKFYKEKAKTITESFKLDVYESKYDAAKELAIQSKSKIMSLYRKYHLS